MMALAAARHSAAVESDREWRRSQHTAQALAPGALRGREIPGGIPLGEYAIRWSVYGGRRGDSRRQGVIGRENLAQHDAERTAIHEDVMQRPHDAPCVVGELHPRDALEGQRTQIEPERAIVGE